MDPKKPASKPLELALVEIETPADDPSRGTGAVTQTKSLGITNADAFLEQAAHEYQSGKVDKALWAKTQGIAGDDESIAIAAYLRARASVLRSERNPRAAKADGPPTGTPGSRREGPPTASRSTQGPTTRTRGSAAEGPATRSRAEPSRAAAARRTAGPRLTRNVMYLGAAAAALSFVAVMLWVLAAPTSTEVARQAITAAVKRPDVPKGAAGAQASNAAVAAADASNGPSLADKVQAMKQARNWNVLVLYAAEWTRKEPANPAAWRELSVGYANLRQLDDAFDAASRAVSLAPADGDAWSGLGRVNIALEKWPDAGAAFEKALAVRADDQDALCGAAAVARREGRARDADALAKRMTSEAACFGLGEPESVSVSVRGPAAKR